MRPALRSPARLAVAVLGPAAIVLAMAGIALAVSGGGYHPGKQGCSGAADANDRHHGNRHCHNFQVLVQDGSGHTYAQAGLQQESPGDNVHGADATVSPDGSAKPTGGDDGSGVSVSTDTHYQPFTPDSCGLFDVIFIPINTLTGSDGCTMTPTGAPGTGPDVTVLGPRNDGNGPTPDLSSGTLYVGADDNMDTGEHDAPDGKHGSKSSQDGPSDGGAVTVSWQPLAATGYADVLTALLSGNFRPLAENPVRIAGASFGVCADGMCAEATTVRQSVYRGSGSRDGRNVYDYSGKKFDPYTCSSGSARDEKRCGRGGEKHWRRHEARHVYAEPGVQVFEDPDPNGSPALPTNLYPLPAAYAGTCGVTVGGGTLTGPSDTPVTNDAGQVSLDPAGC